MDCDIASRLQEGLHLSLNLQLTIPYLEGIRIQPTAKKGTTFKKQTNYEVDSYDFLSYWKYC